MSCVTSCNSTAGGEGCLLSMGVSDSVQLSLTPSEILVWCFCTFVFLKLYVGVIKFGLSFKALKYLFYHQRKVCSEGNLLYSEGKDGMLLYRKLDIRW